MFPVFVKMAMADSAPPKTLHKEERAVCWAARDGFNACARAMEEAHPSTPKVAVFFVVFFGGGLVG